MKTPLEKLVEAIGEMTTQDWEHLQEFFNLLYAAKAAPQGDVSETREPSSTTPPPDQL